MGTKDDETYSHYKNTYDLTTSLAKGVCYTTYVMQQLTIDEIREKAVPILKNAGIKRSAIFGSYVRGEQRADSDVDFLVEYPEGTSLFDIAVLKSTLEDSLKRPVDLVGYNAVKPRLKEYILSEQLPIL